MTRADSPTKHFEATSSAEKRLAFVGLAFFLCLSCTLTINQEAIPVSLEPTEESAAPILGVVLVIGELEPLIDHVFLLNLDALDLQDLSNGLLPVSYASFAKEREELLIENSGDIFIVTTRTGEIRPLIESSTFDSEPVWSPDENKFAFVKDFNSVSLFQEGAQLTLLNPQANSEIHLGNWNPIGEEIAYAEYIFQSGPEGSSVTPRSYIRALEISGHTRDLVNTASHPELSQFGGPAFSPNGVSLAFHALLGDNFRIFLVNLSSGELKELTSIAGKYSNPVWSPDGKYIAAFSHDKNAIAIFSQNGELIFEAPQINGMVVEWVASN